MWTIAAAICVNTDGQLLMVLQGKPDEEKRWALPSGQQDPAESLDACCVRELAEETGYRSRVVRKVWVKHARSAGVDVAVHFFQVIITGGNGRSQDPDGLIQAVTWKTVADLEAINLSFPEGRGLLVKWIKGTEGPDTARPSE